MQRAISLQLLGFICMFESFSFCSNCVFKRWDGQEIYQIQNSKEYVLCRLGDDCVSWPVKLVLEQVDCVDEIFYLFKDLL